MENNPLKAYFRKPGIWVKLPSHGKYYKESVKDLNDMGEIPVYPMTAKDELLLKNADALLNGSALLQLVRSCVPSIVDPNSMPAIDLDAVLVAIRKCTYGEKMSVSAKHDCEHAKETEYDINLNAIIGTIKDIGEIPPVEFDNGIKVYVKPITVKNILDLNWIQFEQVRAVQMAEQQNLSAEQQSKIMQTGYEAISNAGIKVVAESIDTVLLPDGTAVTDPAMILEWVIDMPKGDYAELEKTIMTTNSKGVEKEIPLTCTECGGQFNSNLDMNPVTFFA